ncbi:MAG: MFS transporter [Clostridiales bacterium]|nr:MFS transporter [Clostridiales bacterium]
MNKKDRLTGFFAVMFFFNVAANLAHPVTPTIIVDLKLNNYMFGLAMAAQMTFNFLFSPFWGKMVDRISSRAVLAIGNLGYALGQVFFALARTEAQLLLARMFAGAFCGGCFVAYLTYTVNMSTGESRGKNLAINATVMAVSASTGYFAGGMLGEIHVYYPVWVQVASLVVCAVLSWFVCRDDRRGDAPRLSGRMLIRECNPFAAILQCRRFMTKLLAYLFIVYGLLNLGYMAVEQCFNYYLRDQFGLSSGYNGVIKAALAIVSLVANTTLCMWILRRKRPSFYLLGALGICAAAAVAAFACMELVPFIIACVVVFALYYVSTPLSQNSVAALGQGKDSNLVMGSYNAVKSFCSIFGSALAGFIYEIGPNLPFAFGAVAFAAAAVSMLMFCRAETAR